MAGLAALGAQPQAQEGHRLPSLNAVQVPEGVDDAALRKALLNEQNIDRMYIAGSRNGFHAVMALGTLGALVYCLHCPELEAPFVGSWYLLGMLIPGLAGGLLGPRLLRW